MSAEMNGRRTAQLLDGRAIGVTTLQYVDLDAASIWSLELTWRHGIYGTPERHVVTVVADYEGGVDVGVELVDGYVVDDGVISELNADDERHAVLARHIVTGIS